MIILLSIICYSFHADVTLIPQCLMLNKSSLLPEQSVIFISLYYNYNCNLEFVAAVLRVRLCGEGSGAGVLREANTLNAPLKRIIVF